jgi:hypothetical protein
MEYRMHRRLYVASLALAALGAATAAQAQSCSDGWVSLAVKDVDPRGSNDAIDVSRAAGSYRALRLENSGTGLVMDRVRVVYGDNSFHVEDRRINLQRGERTRQINPRDNNKFVDTVILNFPPDAKASGLARINVCGLQNSAGAREVRPVASAPRPSAPSGAAAPAAPAAAAPPSPPPSAGAAPTSPAPSAAAPGTITAGGDVLFGSQTVGFGVDRDVIRVGADIGKFDKVRLRVLDNDIFLNEMKVIYANGEPDVLAVNGEIKQNTRTRWFTLKGDRFIKEIQLTYRSRPNFKGQARVEAYGEFAEGWLKPGGEGAKFNQGWVLLGAQTAGFVGFDNDLIPVGRNEGGFKQIRVTAKDRAITLNEIRVVYGSGAEDVIPIKTKVEAGSTYGPIDLKGGTRVIKEIRAKYRSRFLDKGAVGKGAAIVEVWGKH